MKKLIVTIAIVLGIGMMSFADNPNKQGGMFRRGSEPYETATGSRTGAESFMLPSAHGQDSDAPTPLGSGIAVLVGLGAAYMVAKRRKED